MNNQPYVSIVMTSYNRERYISQAIDSILSQEVNFQYEIIIGDDFSTDNSRMILENYHTKYPNIFVLNLQMSNQGFGTNWATTLQLARGKYVAFLDDDDYYCDKCRLQEMVDYMDEHSPCGLLHTNYYRLYNETGEMVPNNARDASNEDAMLGLYHGTYPLCFGTCMIRNSLIKQYVNLEDYIRLKFTIQDWPTCILLADYTEFHYMNKLSYVYRKYEGSMSAPKTYDAIIKKYSQEERMYEYICSKFPHKLHYDANEWKQYMHHLLLSLAYRKKDFLSAKKYAQLSGATSVKARCAQNRVSFYLFIMLRQLRDWFKSSRS